MRLFLAILAGLIVASLLVFGIESIPLSDSNALPMDASNDEIRAYMEGLPLIAFIKVLVAHGIGALGGGFISYRIAKRETMIAVWIFSLIFLAFVVSNLILIPHPLWFTIVDILLILPMAYLGGRIAAVRTSPSIS